VDPIHSRYAKADNAVEVMASHVVRAVFGEVHPVDSVLTKDSKDTPSVGSQNLSTPES